ncbi:hypothetical protein ES708_26776 [subsurface metagenome]
MPLEKVTPQRIPAAATINKIRRGATFAPIAEFRKLTASLLTPTIKSDIASIKRTITMSRKTLSIIYRFQGIKINLAGKIIIFQY